MRGAGDDNWLMFYVLLIAAAYTYEYIADESKLRDM